jgi:hypothetical protein
MPPASPQQSPPDAPRKEQFDALFKMLTKMFESLIDFEFKHGVALFGIFAFCVSARGAHLMSSASQAVITVVIVTFTLLHTFWVYLQYRGSDKLYQRLLLLNYVPAEDLETQRITKALAGSFCISHTGFSILACWVVLQP